MKSKSKSKYTPPSSRSVDILFPFDGAARYGYRWSYVTPILNGKIRLGICKLGEQDATWEVFNKTFSKGDCIVDSLGGTWHIAEENINGYTYLEEGSPELFEGELEFYV